MNPLVRALVAHLRAVPRMLHGTEAFSYHAIGSWTHIQLTATSDFLVRLLGTELELGPPQIVTAAGTDGRPRWWIRAALSHGDVRIVVAGPHHEGAPPAQEEG